LLELFDNFWVEVRRAEDVLVTYGHSPYRGDVRDPDCLSTKLLEAYEAIQRVLAPVAKQLMVPLPNMSCDYRPFMAASACEGLLHTLNPIYQLFSRQEWIASPEYIELRAEATREMFAAIAAESKRDCSRKNGVDYMPLHERLLLFIRKQQREKKAMEHEPPTAESLAAVFGVTQGAVSKAMRKIFPGGMKEYCGLFRDGRESKSRGFFTKGDDGSLSVDGIVDPTNFLEDEGEDDGDDDMPGVCARIRPSR
jgi:hypothetical protein